jgi:hypothetical protein
MISRGESSEISWFVVEIRTGKERRLELEGRRKGKDFYFGLSSCSHQADQKHLFCNPFLQYSLHLILSYFFPQPNVSARLHVTSICYYRYQASSSIFSLFTSHKCAFWNEVMSSTVIRD